MKQLTLLLLVLALPACSPTCPEIAVKAWSNDEQKQILAEEKKLSPDSILIPVLEDYVKLRREAK